MFIAGASASLGLLIENQLLATGGADGYSVSVLSGRQMADATGRHVGLFLYRVEVDETRRSVDVSHAANPKRSTLGLEMRYLLTVRGEGAKDEQLMLARCMDILDRHGQLSGKFLAPGFGWEAEDALRVSFAQLSTEDLFHLWASLQLPYRLSVPYVVRTARLTVRERLEVEATFTPAGNLAMEPVVGGF